MALLALGVGACSESGCFKLNHFDLREEGAVMAVFADDKEEVEIHRRGEDTPGILVGEDSGLELGSEEGSDTLVVLPLWYGVSVCRLSVLCVGHYGLVETFVFEEDICDVFREDVSLCVGEVLEVCWD